MVITGLLAALVIAAPVLQEVPPVEVEATVTYYVATGQRTASGEWPAVGGAACSWNFELGQRLVLPGGLLVTCNDRGLLGHRPWVDLYADSHEQGRQWARLYSPTSPVLVLP